MPRSVRCSMLLAMLVFCSACVTSIPELDPANRSPNRLTPDEFRKHVLAIDARGVLRDPSTDRANPHRVVTGAGDNRLRVGSPEFRQYVSEIVQSIRSQKQQYGHVKLLFYFHGGLNSRAMAMQRAAHDIVAIRGERPELYPIYVNWQTSAYGTYVNHLLWIKKGQDFGIKGPFLAPFDIAADLVRSIADIPVANAIQMTDAHRMRAYAGHANEKVVIAETCTTPLDFRQGKSTVTRGQIWRRQISALPTTLLTKWWFAGILSGAGSSAWSSMIYTADRLFYSNAEIHRLRTHFEVEPGQRKRVVYVYDYDNPSFTGNGPLSRFFEALIAADVLDERDEITLVAHSAGAIVATTIVGTFGSRLPIRTLVYMAPAVSIEEILAGGRIAAFLSDKSKNRQLYILALHEQAELMERWYLDLTPHGSLLVWLDQFIQPKHSELRGLTLGRVRNLRTHAHLVPCEIYDRIHITAYNDAANALPDQPQHHGDFGRLPYWNEASWRPEIANVGYLPTTTNPRAIKSEKDR